MAKKGKIQTTPKSTADKKGQSGREVAKSTKAKATKSKTKEKGKDKNKGKAAAKPAQVADKTTLNKWDAYQRAVSEGRERQFLKQNPGFKAKAGLTLPAKSGQNKLNDDTKIGKVLETDQRVAAETARQAGSLQNVGSIETATGTSTGYYDADGRYHIKQEATAPQKQILSQGENLTIGGQQAAAGNLADYSRFDYGGDSARDDVEKAVYSRLTANVDRDYGREFDEMEQRMYNRGIPLDPSNPAYKREMDALNEKYANIKENASNQAVVQGANEYQSEYARQLDTHRQGMTDTAALQGYGTGYQGAPELEYAAPDVNQTSAAELFSATRGQNQDYKVGMTNAQANMLAAQAAGEEDEEDESIPT